MGRRPDLILAAILLVGFCEPAGSPAATPDANPSEFKASFLAEVGPLLTDEERSVFLAIEKAYRQADFVDRFWASRDPFPETGTNELLETWERRRGLALGRYPSLDGDRARTMILLGPPREIVIGLCAGELLPVEVWRYETSPEPPALGLPGASLTGIDLPAEFRLVFVQDEAEADGFRHWHPDEGIESLLLEPQKGISPSSSTRTRQDPGNRCLRSSRTTHQLASAMDWGALVDGEHLIPEADTSWLEELTAFDRPADPEAAAAELPVALTLGYPGRQGSRTVLQGVLTIPRSEVRRAPDGGRTTVRLSGEIVQRDRLVDAFTYEFDLDPENAREDRMTIAFQRLLARGDYDLTVLVEEAVLVEETLRLEEEGSGRRRRIDTEIQVPSAADVEASTETGSELAEANTPASSGDCVVSIVPPPRILHTGGLRVEARVQGEGIQRVTFILDGRPVMSKIRPPYSMEIDLGRAPRLHTLVAVAFAADGSELARDTLPINAGPHRFAVRLLEPRPNQRYRDSLRARIELDLPSGESLDRVELFVNESRQATLFQPPFVQPILLSGHEAITYVRAVAYLADGNSSEDLVFVNLEGEMDSLRVNFVELFTTVVDNTGRPVEGLERSDFAVLEEGIEQRLARFERVRDLPIHAGLMLDTSTSMTDELPDAVQAGLRFFEGVLTPKDRASVVVFNDAPALEVPFTNRIDVLSNGVRNLQAGGETALFDSLVFTLHYFAGIRGKRAIVLLSDGSDSGSVFTFEEALDFARRTGVTVYTIGLGVSARDLEARSVLRRLARETGGWFFSIDGVSQLDPVYGRIEEELRSQYLLGYQSSIVGGDEFREVSVVLSRKGLEARTIPGYYP